MNIVYSIAIGPGDGIMNNMPHVPNEIDININNLIQPPLQTPGSLDKAQKKTGGPGKTLTQSWLPPRPAPPLQKLPVRRLRPDPRTSYIEDNPKLTVGTWNVKLDAKRLSDPIFLSTFIDKCDIAVLTETKSRLKELSVALQQSHAGSNFQHKSHRSGREVITTGGTAILTAAWLRPHLKSEKQIHPSIIHCTYDGNVLGLDRGQMMHLIGGYIPHRSSKYYDDSIWEKLHMTLAALPEDDTIIIAGDLNSRVGNRHPLLQANEALEINNNNNDIDLTTQICRETEDMKVNTNGNSLLRLLGAAQLVLLHGLRAAGGHPAIRSQDFDSTFTFQPLRRGKRAASAIDHIAITARKLKLVQSYKIGDISPHSDHRPVFARLEMPRLRNGQDGQQDLLGNRKGHPGRLPPIPEHEQIKWPRKNQLDPPPLRNWANPLGVQTEFHFLDPLEPIMNLSLKLEEISNAPPQEAAPQLPQLTREISEALSKALWSFKPNQPEGRPQEENDNNFLQEKQRNFRKPPRNAWFDSELYQRRARARKLQRRKQTEESLAAWKKYKETCKEKKREWRLRSFQDLEAACTENRPRLWEIADRLLGELKQNKIPVDAYALAEYFEGVFKSPDAPRHLCPPFNEPTIPAACARCPFTVRDVQAALNRVDGNKAGGGDGMPSHAIARLRWHHGTSKLIYNLFKLYIHYKYWPPEWNELIIAPVLKKEKSPTDPASYRPIHLISTLAKVFASIVDDLLQRWVPRTPEQFGFERGHGTRDCVFTLSRIFEKYRLRKEGLQVVFVDFKGAFDSVDRRKLLSKIDSLVADGKIEKSIRDMIAIMYSRVHATIQGTGLRIEETVGVKQGDPLGPRLFSLFIADLPKALHPQGVNTAPARLTEDENEWIRGLLYADDLVAISLTTDGMQAQMDALASYCDSWGLTVNTLKTEHMRVGRNIRLNQEPLNIPTITYRGIPIKQVKTFKYLGVLLSSSGSLRPFFEAKLESVRRAMFVTLGRVSRLSDRCPLTFRITLLRAYVISIATYCTDCVPVPKWYTDEVDKIIFQYLRWTIQIRGTPSKAALFRECGIVDAANMIARAQASYLLTNIHFRKPPHIVLSAITSCLADHSSSMNRNWLLPSSNLLIESGLGNSSLPEEVVYAPKGRNKWAASEWLKRYCDFKWIQQHTPQNPTVVEPHEIIPELSDDARRQTFGYPCSFAPRQKVIEGLQRQTLLHGLNIWHPDLATRETRKVQIHGSLALAPHQLSALVTFRIGCPPTARNIIHDLPICDRVCKYCEKYKNTRIVEDDIHVVIDCPLYAYHRVKLFEKMPPKSNLKYPFTPQQLLGRFLTPSNKEHTIALSNYLHCLLYTRDLFEASQNRRQNTPKQPFEIECKNAIQKACNQQRESYAVQVESELLLKNWIWKGIPYHIRRNCEETRPKATKINEIDPNLIRI